MTNDDAAFGQKYVTVDADGRASAFYAARVHNSIPADAIPISDEVWAEWSQASQRKVWQGGELVDAPEPPEPAPASRTCTPREFMDRFEDEEEDRITVKAAQAAAAGQPRLQRFLNRLIASTVVELDHPELKAGMDEVVAAELLTRERADAILASG